MDKLILNYDLNATAAPVLDKESPHEILRIATWNTQSFNIGKMDAIHERLNKCYDIALLQEVHNPTTKTNRVFNFTVNEDIYISPGTNHKAGVAIYINTKNSNIKVIPNSLRIDLEGRIVSIQISWFNHRYNLLSLYAPANEDGARVEFFDKLMKSEHIQQGMQNIIGGDFNVCLDPTSDLINYSDVSGYKKTHKGSMRILTDLLAYNNVQDSWEVYKSNFFEDKQLWTWHQGGPSSNSDIHSRLDRIYVSDNITHNVIHAGTQDTTISDHLIYEIHLTTPEEHRKYKTGWKFNIRLLENKYFTDKIGKLILNIRKETELCTNPLEILGKQKELIEMVKRVSKRFSKAQAKKLNQRKSNLEHKRFDIQYRLRTLKEQSKAPKEELDQLHKRYQQVNEELLEMFERNAEAAKIRTHTNVVLHSEIPSSYFLRLQNERRRKARIEEVLLEDGTPSHSQEDIVSTHLTFQSNLYSKKPIEEEAKQTLLDTIRTKVTDEDTERLNQPFSKEEILMAIKSLGKNKAAGTDGLPAEFYQFFADSLADINLIVFNTCYNLKDLPQSTREALICLLFKKGDKRLPKNWRPISLLNTDYKILAKLLAARLRTLLPYLLSPDQNGFVAGRQLEDAVMMCQMTIDYLAINKETAYMVMLDQEKAFDRVDPEYLLDILRAYKIPEYLINWVSIIYSIVPTKLCINGQITENILLKSGVRQGCPLSPLLFVLSIEPLANLVRNHADYKGISLPNNTSIRVGMFADDTCFYAKDEASISIIKEMTEIYAKGSGGRANIDKTEILPIGYIGEKTFESEIENIKVLDPSNPVRLLGIMVGNNVDPIAVWNNILGRVDKLLNEKWKDRNMSLRGKLVVIKHLALPIIMFTAPFIQMPLEVTKKIDRIFRKFIYSGKKCKVALKTLQLPIEQGGLDVPNIKDLTDAARIRWVKKLVDDQTPVIWRTLAIHMLNISCKTKMGTNIFRHPEFKVTHTRDPHLQHWILVLEAWRRLEGKGAIDPKTIDEIRSTYLEEYDPKVGKQLARHGYNTVNDILTLGEDITKPEYLKRTQLIKKPKHNMISAKAYDEFVEKLPKETANPKELIDSNKPDTIYRVTDEAVPELRRSKRIRNSKGRTHVPHKTKTKVQQLTVLNDHYVIPSGKPIISVDVNKLEQVDVHNGKCLGKTFTRGNATMDKLQLKLDGKMQPLEKYSRMAAYRTISNAKETNHKHHAKWETIFPDEWICWPTLKTHPTNAPNLINVRYLLMHGAIRIGTQARHWLKDADLTCPTCKEQCDDVHLFLKCSTTVQAWKHVEDKWSILQDKHPMLKDYPIKNSYKLFGPPSGTPKNSMEHNIYLLCDSFIGHMQLIIWNAYNKYMHEGTKYEAKTLVETYEAKIERALKYFTFAMKSNFYIGSRWGCPRLDEGKLEQINMENNNREKFGILIKEITMRHIAKKRKRQGNAQGNTSRRIKPRTQTEEGYR